MRSNAFPRARRARHPFLVVVLAATVMVSCLTTAGGPAPESEAVAFVKGMGLGYNLGNTLDATGGTMGNKIANFETAWGAPVTTKAIFEDLKNRGFDTIRIPVAWSNLMAEDYTIHPDLMKRVDEIVHMVLDSGMYAIINIHWDGGWIKDFPSAFDESMKKYTRIWQQVSDAFRDVDEHLVFESMNEEGVFDDVWNRYTDGDASPKKQKAFDMLTTVNQAFVDVVRGSGGRNASRYLLIAGYATDIDLTCSPEFTMPKDRAGHSIVSVHYYTPSTFTILEKDADWGMAARSWGTPEEVARVKADMYRVKVRFIDKGIPAILGEYGTVTAGKDPESVRRYLTEVARDAWGVGMCPILWGAADQHYDRRALAFTDPLLGNMYLSLSRTTRANLAFTPDDFAVARAAGPVAPASAVPAVAAAPATPAPAAPAPAAAGPSEITLDEPVEGTSGNSLSESVGPVTIVIDKDTSFTSNDAVKGATAQMVEFQGRKALKVTSNSRREIRVAFVLDSPARLAGSTALEFSVAGFDGSGGSYNFGLLWTAAKDSGERLGSFYVGNIRKDAWTSVTVNLQNDEQWGRNFSAARELYCVQFWSNQGKTIYISGVSLR